MASTRLTRSRPWLAGGALLAVLAVAGLVTGDYQTSLLTTGFIYAIAAVSLDVVWGYVGAPDLGHALWFGIGALTVGIMTTSVDDTGLVVEVHGGVGRYLLALLIGMVVAAAVAGIVGKFSFSARGSAFYIAVVTLSLTIVAASLYSQFPGWTGGGNGLFGFAPIGVSQQTWYYVALAVLAVVALLAVVLVRSDLGLLLRAVRDNENRTRYLGYNVENVKTAVFMGGAAVSALAGGLMALVTGLVSADLFSFLFATQMLVWVAVGGRATIIGPVIGAIGLELVGARLSAGFPAQWSLVEGALFVAVVVFVPDGILPPIGRLVARLTGWRASGQRRLVADTTPAPEQPTRTPVARVGGLHFGYGSLQVLRGIDLDIERGQLVCIVGPNGAGKSTLVSVLADGRLPIRGSVSYLLGERTINTRPTPHRLARLGVSRKFQSPALFASLSCAETVLLAQRAGRLLSPLRRSQEIPVSPASLDVLEATGLGGRDNESAAVLAHGLRQGLEIAAAVASRPQVLLLDEPTAGLTHNERRVVGSVLRRLVDKGMTVVLIEHDMDFVNEIADRVVVLHHGQIIEDGAPHEVSDSGVVREAYLGTAI